MPHRPRHRALARSRRATTTSWCSRTASRRSPPGAGHRDRRPATRCWPSAPAHGRCEVVCFTSDHDASFAALTPRRARTVIEAWADRTAALSALPGGRAGVLLREPRRGDRRHPAPPARADLRLPVRHAAHPPAADAGAAPTASAPAGNLLRRRPGRRAPRRARGWCSPGEHWTAYVPYAARWPVEVHLAPHRDVPDLAALDDAERDELADVYLDAAAAARPLLRRRGGGRSRCRTSPPGTRRRCGEGRDARRLHLQVISVLRAPGKLKYLAGSESGMGAWVNDVDRRSGSPRGCARSRRADDQRRRWHAARGDGFAGAFGSRPRTGVWSAPGPGQPDRRAHRLQRRPRACRSRCRSAPSSPPRLRRDDAPCCVSVRCRTGEQVDASPSTTSRPGRSGGLGGVRRRRRLGAARGRAPACPGSTSSSTADVPLGRGPVVVGRPGVRRRGGAGRPVRARPRASTTPRAPGSPRPARAPRTTSSAPRPAAWTRRRRCAAPRGHALLLDCRDGSVEQVPFDLAAHGLALLVIDTRAEHALVDGEYARAAPQLRAGRAPSSASPALRDIAVRRPRRGAGAARRRRVRPAPGPARRHRERAGAGRPSPLLRAGPGRGGRAAARRLARARCATTSRSPAPELDLAVETARGAGALGARMTGGGFGGSAIALVPAGAVEAVTEAVTKAFADHGFRQPVLLRGHRLGAGRPGRLSRPGRVRRRGRRGGGRPGSARGVELVDERDEVGDRVDDPGRPVGEALDLLGPGRAGQRPGPCAGRPRGR